MNHRISGFIIPRIVILLFILAVGAGGVHAQQTAYEAMKTLSGERGSSLLGNLLEISGIQGSTQPLVWKLTVADPAARGGFREFEISGGRILSERTPVAVSGSRPPETPINVQQLNLDSDGAFTVANNAAAGQRIGFDSLNYTLFARDAAGSPQWTIELIGLEGTIEGVVELSANDGAVISARSGSAAVDGLYAEEDADGEPIGGAIGATRDALHDAGEATKRTFLRGAGTVQEWLTGERTIDRDIDE